MISASQNRWVLALVWFCVMATDGFSQQCRALPIAPGQELKRVVELSTLPWQRLKTPPKASIVVVRVSSTRGWSTKRLPDGTIEGVPAYSGEIATVHVIKGDAKKDSIKFQYAGQPGDYPAIATLPGFYIVQWNKAQSDIKDIDILYWLPDHWGKGFEGACSAMKDAGAEPAALPIPKLAEWANSDNAVLKAVAIRCLMEKQRTDNKVTHRILSQVKDEHLALMAYYMGKRAIRKRDQESLKILGAFVRQCDIRRKLRIIAIGVAQAIEEHKKNGNTNGLKELDVLCEKKVKELRPKPYSFLYDHLGFSLFSDDE